MHDVSDSARRSVELTDLRRLPYAVVDVETTGTRLYGERGDRVMEIAIVHVDEDRVTTAAEFLIDPQRPVSRFVARLTGIRWEDLYEAPTFGDVAQRIQDALEGRVFVAHNATFDWGFVSTELRRATGRGLRGKKLCTVRFARTLLSHLPRRNLDALTWHYDLEFRGRRHRAGPDARATAEVLLQLLRDARRRDIDTWTQLQALLRTQRPPLKRSYLPQPVRDEAIA
jgi:DNA polymerase III epsilon subunit family exonuclease